MGDLAEDLFPPRIRHRVVHCRHDEYDVLVDRRTKWGNPKRLEHYDGDRLRCLEAYLLWLRCRVTSEYDPQYYEKWDPGEVRQTVEELEGKVLACWCAPKLCHGHVLAAMAAADDPLDAVYWCLDRLEEVSA